jgi:polyhydroxybutyrate depolymerase
MIRRAASLVLAVGCLATEAHGEAVDLTIDTADGPRHAIVVAPGGGPRPTVLVLHGATGTAALTLRWTGFAEATASRGFAAVYPDGIDVAFLRALVDRLVADRVAQRDKVFIAGISNGGMMSFTMMCKASELFAGIGTVIANMPAGVEPCTLKPVPLVMVNGTADPMVPYRGGGVGFSGERGMVDSVEQTLARFIKVDRCTGTPVSRTLATTSSLAKTSVVRIDWQGCSSGTSVTLYRVDGGGHTIPGRPAFFGGMLGPSNQDMVAADAILDAFVGR